MPPMTIPPSPPPAPRPAPRAGDAPPPVAPPPAPRRRLLPSLALALAALLLAATAMIYVTFVVVPRKAVETTRDAASGVVRAAKEGAGALADLGRDLGDRLVDGLGVRPRVTVNQEVVTEQSAELLELATVERRIRVTHTYRHTWLGSTKRIRLTGDYVVKAGFDLSEGFAVDIEGEEGAAPTSVRVRAGDPRVLSVEQVRVQVEEDEGLWNNIQPGDRQRSLNDLQRLARRQAARGGLLREAQSSLERQVQAALLEELAPTRFDFGDGPAISAPRE
jgi:hypothetical protein